MAHINSTHRHPRTNPPLTTGFCVDSAGEEKLLAYGVERIWMRGRGHESLDEAIYDLRLDEPGDRASLAIVGDLRMFGETNDDIADRIDEIEDLGVTLIDIEHPEDSHVKIGNRARKTLHAARPMPSSRVAKRRGSLGGKAKAAMAELARAIRCAPDIVQRLCDHAALTWDDCAEILGPPFSKSTLQRLWQR